MIPHSLAHELALAAEQERTDGGGIRASLRLRSYPDRTISAVGGDTGEATRALARALEGFFDAPAPAGRPVACLISMGPLRASIYAAERDEAWEWLAHHVGEHGQVPKLPVTFYFGADAVAHGWQEAEAAGHAAARHHR